MTQIRDKTLTGRISLDGGVFVDCEFKDAVLIFEGGAPPQFQNCRFTKTSFGFEGAAGNTVNFLRAMLQPQTNMRQIVFGVMPELNQQ